MTRPERHEHPGGAVEFAPLQPDEHADAREHERGAEHAKHVNQHALSASSARIT